MDLNIILKGLMIGFSIAAPVGPIGVLCIRRTLAEGRWVGLFTGLGAATADALYGCAAAFGLSVVTQLLVGAQGWLRLVGGGFLVYLGVRTFLARPATQAAAVKKAGSGLAGAYFSTVALTLTNPMTILSFAAVFAGLGAGDWQGPGGAALLVGAVFCGSAAWWLLLSGGVSLIRERFQGGWMVWVNRVSGAVLCAFGLWQLLALVRVG